jgi:hypothetical protein
MVMANSSNADTRCHAAKQDDLLHDHLSRKSTRVFEVTTRLPVNTSAHQKFK